MKEFWNNMSYIFKSIKKYDKLLLFFLIINNFVMLFNIVLPIVLPRYIIDGLMEDKDYNIILCYILLFAVGTTTASALTYLLKSSIYVRSMTLRFKLIIESGKKFISMKIFKKIVEDKTAIFISHRMSSCLLCDTIVLVQDGTVLAIGTHQKLLKENDLYRKMWEAQAQYYQ